MFSVDSWLDGDNNNRPGGSIDSEENIYNGRSSPQKQFNPSKSGINRGISANTIDSFDNAYNRKPPSASLHNTANDDKNDDFFDS